MLDPLFPFAISNIFKSSNRLNLTPVQARRRRLPCVCLLLPLAAAAALTSRAAVTVPPLFGHNMVLQRDLPIPVHGTATPNRTIRITFNNTSQSTTSDASGSWRIVLKALAANAKGSSLSIAEAGGNTLTFTNVVVGDVWICSGQSNMAMSLGSCDRPADINSANFPTLRQFSVPLVTSDVPLTTTTGSWSPCSPATAGGFSAVAFHFGRKLTQELNATIPIGLVVSSVGGTRIDPWLPPEGATDIPALDPLYSQSILPWGPFSLFNGMLHPLAPMPAKGLLWYQGENAETTTQSPDSYYLKMKALSQGMRRLLDSPDMAFYLVQLANWNQGPTSPAPVLVSGGWDADTRLQQANAMALPHAGMASAIDIGDPADMHPKNKLDLGERLARWALHHNYGFANLVTSGPIFRDATLSGQKVICSFDHTGTGLMVGSKSGYDPTTEVPNGKLNLFSIAGADGVWYHADAKIQGDTVELSSPSVPNPRKVSYACWQNPAGANLYNREGLPASPFHVDDLSARFTIAASTTGNGTISPAGTTSYLKRKAIRYTLTPAPDHHIIDVKVNGNSVGAVDSYTFDPIQSNQTIEATFGPAPPTFTLTTNASAGGTLAPAGPFTLARGTSQHLMVKPTVGARADVRIDGKPIGARERFTVSHITSPHTVTATFSHAVNAQAGYGGSITPSGTNLVTHGGSRTFNISPMPGFKLAKLTLNGTPVNPTPEYTLANITSSQTLTASFSGPAKAGSIPQTNKILCAFLGTDLPDNSPVASWPSHLPQGRKLTPQGSPVAETIDGRKFVRNSFNDADCLDLGQFTSPVPCTGASIVTVVKPSRFGSDTGWTSVVDVFYDRLVLGILNGTGRVVVRRNGNTQISQTAIPDGQTTILSLVVQQNGTYEVFANSSLIMENKAASDLSTLTPGIPGAYASHITFGRNWPDSWSTYNGYYSDTFLYTTSLTPTERQQLESWLANRLADATAANPTFEDWIASFPNASPARGFHDDPDHDQISNGIENFLGTDPTQPNPLPAITANTSTSALTFRHTRNLTPAASLNVTYQWSDNLSDWFASGQSSPTGSSAQITSEVIPSIPQTGREWVEVTITPTGIPAHSLYARIHTRLADPQ